MSAKFSNVVSYIGGPACLFCSDQLSAFIKQGQTGKLLNPLKKETKKSCNSMVMSAY